MVAALEWVRDNIAAFGGDPDQVTIAGESAGALGVYALMATPCAEGLFSRAIAQSGGPISFSAATGRRRRRVAGRRSSASSRPARRLPPSRSPSCWRRSRRCRRPPAPGSSTRPTGATTGPPPLPFAPDRRRRRAARLDRVPIAGGASVVGPAARRLQHRGGPDLPGADGHPQSRRRRVPGRAACPPGLGADGVDAYRAAQPDASAADLLVAIGTDAHFRQPAIRAAEMRFDGPAPTFMYEFAWRSPAFGGMFGACHALEIPFAFDNLEKGGRLAGDNPPQELADVMHAAWVRFADRGDPGWPAYDADRRAVMTLRPARVRSRRRPAADGAGGLGKLRRFAPALTPARRPRRARACHDARAPRSPRPPTQGPRPAGRASRGPRSRCRRGRTRRNSRGD